jgi:hypothetical protein
VLHRSGCRGTTARHCRGADVSLHGRKGSTAAMVR